MSVYKDNATGKWRVIYRYTDITGKRKQTQKRGFETKREAVAWEHEMMLKAQAKLDMTFGSFYEIYEADKASRLKQSTWETKSHIIRTKILPYFADRKIDEIEVRDVIAWQNELLAAFKDEGNSDYAKYLIAEKITDYDSKTLEELSVSIMTKEEFEKKQIEKMQETISEKARELWNDAFSNIDGTVYSNKWKYLDYLEEIRYRNVSTLTLQQVNEPVISFWEFNEMKEHENVEATMQVESTQNVAVEIVADNQNNFELDTTENVVLEENPVVESAVEEAVVVERVIEKALTVEERAKEIATFIRDNYGKYDNVPVKVKAELFRFSINDLGADMKLHSLVLKELNEKMYGADSFEDYMSIVDATEKKQSDEMQNVDYYSNDKRWNRSR